MGGNMKNSRTLVSVLVLLSTALILDCGGQKSGDYFIQPVDFTRVRVDDAFWSPRLETNRKVTIPYAFQKCEETFRIDNFAAAGGVKKGSHRGYRFNDSDVYKVIEGAAYALHLHPDPKLEAYVDGVIDLIAGAQEEDGYLFTAKTAMDPDKPSVRVKDRWDSIQDDHELYCAGHLYEAAVAYYHATGKRKLLDAALKNADLIYSVFGPGDLRYPPGHQEIEIGLARLYRETGNDRYLKLAKFFLDERGDSTGHRLYGEYAQDHIPVLKQTKAVGHAVRAAYMYSGMADIAALTGNRPYIRAIKQIWNDVVSHKLYVTGGIGASGGNEGFGGDYHLPNASAYCETCASIANAMWNHRLFLMTGESKYMDIVERIIYNSFLSGISMEGDRFFYPNRLQTFTGEERAPWFGCACCPSNVVRFVPSIPGYAYAHRGSDLYVNLYMSGSSEIQTKEQTVRLIQESRYPWDGNIHLKIHPTAVKKFSIFLRIPGWVTGTVVPSGLYHFLDAQTVPFTVRINDEEVPVKITKGYIRIKRFWQAGDEISLSLPMEIRRIVAHDSVEADIGKVAVERGPIVFCAEGHDQPEPSIRNLLLPDESELKAAFDPFLLNGVEVITGEARALRFLEDELTLRQDAVKLRMIPYYSRAHRGKTPMSVWIAHEESAAMPLKPSALYSGAVVSASFGSGIEAVHDQMEPRSSIDHDVPYFHWWPHKGTLEWIQYDFTQPVTLSSTEVYWFDDTGMGECRIPLSWRLLYRKGDMWNPVENSDDYTVGPDRFDRVSFRPVKTRAVRLEIQSREDRAGGIHEWKVK
jgi:DUF1680 family protein